jgi:hypothetical protein
MDTEGGDSLLCVVGLGSAGWVLRPQGSSGEARLSRCAANIVLIASSARSDPIPLLAVVPGMGPGKGLRFWMRDILSAAASQIELFHRFRDRLFTVSLGTILI